MGPITKLIQSVTRWIGTGLIVLGAVNLSLYIVKSSVQKTDVQVLNCLLLSIAPVAGLILIWKSAAIARRLGDNFDE